VSWKLFFYHEAMFQTSRLRIIDYIESIMACLSSVEGEMIGILRSGWEQAHEPRLHPDPDYPPFSPHLLSTLFLTLILNFNN